ncbi:MAG: S8 family serine peptidase, partial [Segetibacter sp.]
MTGLLKKTSLFLLVIYCQLAASAQGKVDYKIDPVYRYIIESVKTKSVNGLPAFVRNVKPTPGFAVPNALPEERYECIVYTKNARSLSDSGMLINSSFPTFATVWATLEQIVRMAEMRQVDFIEAPKVLNKVNDLVVGSSGASLLHQRRLNNTVYKGKNVLMAIFDSGIDWKHLDFRNPDDTTKSRILRIWDQTLTAVSGEAPPAGFNYGVEYSQSQINNEIDGTPANFVREKDTDGHGTHVAGTAAGNGSALPSKKYTGVAPESDIIIIKGGDSSFLDSRVIDAITYLQTLSTTLGKPVVLNLSLGTLLGAHDGTRPVEAAINSFTSSASGRAVAAAAGNDGGSNKHNQLSLAANGAGTVSFTVPAGASGSSGSEVFSYRIYSSTNGSLNAALTPPGGGAAVTVTAGQFTSSNILSGNFTISFDNNIDPGNNIRYVDVSLGRNGSNTASPAGTYTLPLPNN